MQLTTLGRTGFRVSRMGLGGGGHSRLGKSTGRSEHESVAVVRKALDLGINFIDTAEGYGTEEIVGKGIAGRDRSKLFVSTKKSMGEVPLTAAQLREGLEQSLRRLRTDYIDIYNLHGLSIKQYEHALTMLVPEMLKLRDEGKLRAVGVTEAFNSDRGHVMLSRAMRDDCWDVIMVGFSILNQSARDRVLKRAIEKNVGVQCMFAVRAALSQPPTLKRIIDDLRASGQLKDWDDDELQNPLSFLSSDDVAPSITDATYRFCRDEPGMHVILSGTGSIPHLEENFASLQRPSLPAGVRERLVRMFEGIDTVSGQ